MAVLLFFLDLLKIWKNLSLDMMLVSILIDFHNRKLFRKARLNIIVHIY